MVAIASTRGIRQNIVVRWVCNLVVAALLAQAKE